MSRRAERRLERAMRAYGVESLPPVPADSDDSPESWALYGRSLEALPLPIVQALSDLTVAELAADGVVWLWPPDDDDPGDDDPNGGQRARSPPNRKPAGRRRAFRCKETSMNNAIAPCVVQCLSFDRAEPAPGPGAWS
jgi:hypothetical protein